MLKRTRNGRPAAVDAAAGWGAGSGSGSGSGAATGGGGGGGGEAPPRQGVFQHQGDLAGLAGRGFDGGGVALFGR
ncbi:hypothetical protein, partial [Bordetella pertussis]|uniref:hypothetical protein n=1 Tax=Bordetella pertussis TaxID=520 RepID=UPI00366AE532